MDFIEILNRWYSENKRDLPWRKTKDPYHIWVCEVIFQQTRINQGLEYYNKFTQKFPTVSALANATEDEVLKYWEGLGYYSRARNLHFSAKYIMNELDGEFPTTYNEIIKLKGVGDYTASAIASICFNEATPAIDGNALRVYSRVFNSFRNIADPSTAKYFKELVKPSFNKNSGDKNQAIMELGALVCTPKNPNCQDCPIQTKCLAFKEGTQNELPIKEKKLVVKNQQLNYTLLYTKLGLFIEKRDNKGIWKSLYEITPSDSLNKRGKEIQTVKHKLTHRNLTIQFYEYSLSEKELLEYQSKGENTFISWKDVKNYAFPKPIKEFLYTFVASNKDEKTLML